MRIDSQIILKISIQPELCEHLCFSYTYLTLYNIVLLLRVMYRMQQLVYTFISLVELYV